MRVFYFCLTGVHTALVAGYLHLGILSQEKRPTQKDLIGLKGFNSVNTQNLGKILYLGTCHDGNEIYSLGVSGEKDLGPTALRSLLELFKINNDKYKLVSTFPCIDFNIDLGTKIKMIFNVDGLSTGLISRGITKNFSKIVRLVEETKFKLKEGGGSL